MSSIPVNSNQNLPTHAPSANDLHERLTLEKRVAKAQIGNNTNSAPIPSWMEQANEHQYAKLMKPLQDLLSHLPTVVATQNENVIGRYYQDIVKELTTVFYALHTLIEKDGALSEAERTERYAILGAEYQSQLQAAASMLGLLHEM